MATKKKMLQAAAGVPTGPEGAWDLSYAYYDDPFRSDITTASYEGQSFLTSAEGSPTGLFFKPDGTKMYVTGDGLDRVYEYALSTAWDVTTASFGPYVTVGTNPECLFFSPDGTKMYTASSSSDYMAAYTLTTAWDVTSAGSASFVDISSFELVIRGLFFSPDGLNMYITGTASSAVKQLTLSTAWDVSTASFLQQFSLVSSIGTEEDLSFNEDGTRMFVLDSSTDDVTSFALSTPWDISTASVLSTFSVAAQETTPSALFMSAAGFMYVLGPSKRTVYQYPLGGFSVYDRERSPSDVFFKPDGTEMYIIGTTGDDVNQYSLSTAWDTSTATYTRVFDTGTVTLAPQGLYFKPDGTTLYTIGSSSDAVSQWSLSVPWDISSTSYVQQFSVSTQDTFPTAVHFKTDGTKMFVMGLTGDDINEYDLSTAWDISTAAFNQSFSVISEDGQSYGLFFKPDGTKMYTTGTAGDEANEYDLSTAWDVSTASYLQNFSLGTGTTTGFRIGIFFRQDGTQMFAVSAVPDKVFTYSLGVQQ